MRDKISSTALGMPQQVLENSEVKPVGVPRTKRLSISKILNCKDLNFCDEDKIKNLQLYNESLSNDRLADKKQEEEKNFDTSRNSYNTDSPHNTNSPCSTNCPNNANSVNIPSSPSSSTSLKSSTKEGGGVRDAGTHSSHDNDDDDDDDDGDFIKDSDSSLGPGNDSSFFLDGLDSGKTDLNYNDVEYNKKKEEEFLTKRCNDLSNDKFLEGKELKKEKYSALPKEGQKQTNYEKLANFMEDFITTMFDPKRSFSSKKKEAFIILTSDSAPRELFVKGLNSRRASFHCHDVVFDRLVTSLSIVLNQCEQTGDWTNARKLMLMCFTYYRTEVIQNNNSRRNSIQKRKEKLKKNFDSNTGVFHLSNTSIPENQETSGGFGKFISDFMDQKFEDKTSSEPALNSTPQYVNPERMMKYGLPYSSSPSDSPNFISRRFSLPNISIGKFLPKFGSDSDSDSEMDEGGQEEYETDAFAHDDNCYDHSDEEELGGDDDIQNQMDSTRMCKEFLHTHLRQLSIWKSKAFWECSFFELLEAEEKKQEQRQYQTLEEAEKADFFVHRKNRVFAILGPFLSNMKDLDLSQQACDEFLSKMSEFFGLETQEILILKEMVQKGAGYESILLTLKKDPIWGFGMTLVTTKEEKVRITVKAIKTFSAVDRNGLVQPGDRLKCINGVDLESAGLSLGQVKDILTERSVVQFEFERWIGDQIL